MIRRFVTMAGTVDVKAGIKNILECIEVASKDRPEQVKFLKTLFPILIALLLIFLVQKFCSTCCSEQNKTCCSSS